MNDDFLSDDDFIRELTDLCDGEVVGPCSPLGGVSRPEPSPRKAETLARLAALGVARVEVEYNGYGDEGVIEGVTAFGADDAQAELPQEVADAIVKLVYETLPCGWEIDDGSYGLVEFDVRDWVVRYCHSRRVVEAILTEWES